VIWDLHCHLSGVEGRTPEQRAENLLRFADRLAIERLCLYMGYPFLEDPTPQQLREQNDQVLAVLRQFPDRFLGFVYLNPRHPAASLDEFRRCVVDGPMVGVKLWVAARAHLPALDAIVKAATAEQAVVFQHTWLKTGGLKTGGNLPGESTPMEVAALAARHPNARLICGHTGGAWEAGILAIRHQPNLAADLAGSEPTAGFVEMAVRELGAQRVIYGSDAGGRSFASQLGKVMGAAISNADRGLILGGNLRRLLLPILTRKGIRA